MRIAFRILLPIALAFATATAAQARDSDRDSHVVGVQPAQLRADYWIERQSHAERIVLDASAIAKQNAQLRRLDPSVNDIEHLPAQLDRVRVRAWIDALSQAPAATMFDERGAEIPAATMAALSANVALDAIPEQQPTRYALVTRRANLRTFPTRMRAFNTPGNTDIDRFQENALFPGTPVALVHKSRDGRWYFVVGNLYEAWIEKRYVAEGPAQQVFGYGRKTPYLVVTGATVRTTFTPEQRQVSALQLDMGVRVPLLDQWPADRPVNGQHPYTARVIELPIRDANGELALVPALLPLGADVAADYLPLNRERLLHQSFKFLGERYGWGHSYNARDCSGFVSEVYRSFGVVLPRNTGDQAISPAFNRIAFDDTMDRAARLKVLRTLEVGDLIYIPGHVMMVIGQVRGAPYVIHDTIGISYRNEAGALERVVLNGVAVTPLAPLMAGEQTSTIERISSVQRIRH